MKIMYILDLDFWIPVSGGLVKGENDTHCN